MAKKILLDTTHDEETRVALLDDRGRLEDYDIESLARKLLKGNIFLAKVTRVEPSLQAAFVDYGGNRHGFLPFSEIHPDYYRIPVADKEALMRAEAELRKKLEEAAEAEEDGELDPEQAARIIDELTRDDADLRPSGDGDAKKEEKSEKRGRGRGRGKPAKAAVQDASEDLAEEVEGEAEYRHEPGDVNGNVREDAPDDFDGNFGAEGEFSDEVEEDTSGFNSAATENGESEGDDRPGRRGRFRRRRGRGRRGRDGRPEGRDGRGESMAASSGRPQQVRDDEDIDNPMQPLWRKIRRSYKIQEVIKRGQIMLIQVNKEERGNKGAAVTTYITLPGRYCVLMPNSPQGGGVSRKIADRTERKRMRDILKGLDIPDGMSIILRTAGLTRTKVEIKRDLTYLMRLWNSIRDLTLRSTAPAQIHEEGNLIQRLIRDVYSKDYETIEVAGERGLRESRGYMKMMMPTHVKKIVEHTDPVPLFVKYNVERQIEQIHENTVQLPSGGYLVINPTEALVSIDVNSGRATRERHIEETALKTNLEAAEEVARQLRMRDLGGLIVIDFIDMENRKNNRLVEKRVQQALSKDRAKVQCGQISNFGLMELSRQRLRPSMTEKNFTTCPHCHGKGVVRTVDGAALNILRAVEAEALNGQVLRLSVEAPADVALFLLNTKRKDLGALEERYGFAIEILIDEDMGASDYAIHAQRPAKAKREDQSREGREGRGRDHRGEGRNEGRGDGRHRGEGRPARTRDAEEVEDALDELDEDAVSETREQREPRGDRERGERGERGDRGEGREGRRRRRGGRNRNRGRDRDRQEDRGEDRDEDRGEGANDNRGRDRGRNQDRDRRPERAAAQAEPAAETPAAAPEAAEEPQKATRGRKGAASKAKSVTDASPAEAPAEPAAKADKPAKGKTKAEQPADEAKPARKTAAKKAETAEEAPAKGAKKPAAKGKAKKDGKAEDNVVKIEAAADKAAKAPKETPSEYNVIVENSGQKKKGWWTKLLE